MIKKINKIENVLVSIKSRINKANEKGLDVSSLSSFVIKAEAAIKVARDAVATQIKKTYTVTVPDEAGLKGVMKALRDTFKTDIKAVREKVKLAHQAVRDTATTLAKIPRIDEDSASLGVEDNNSTTNN